MLILLLLAVPRGLLRKDQVADYILAIRLQAVESAVLAPSWGEQKQPVCVILLQFPPAGEDCQKKDVQRSFMPEPFSDATPKIPLPISKELRTLAHDLSNSLETIMQATYLLSQVKLDDANKRWLDLIDQATRDAAKINRAIREVLRSQSQEP
jgi:hypothetical protein